MTRFLHHALVMVLALAACSTPAPEPASTQSEFLYLWTAAEGATEPDFLAVLDVTESGSRYSL